MAGSLPILNASDAKFECIYGRGCDGMCCRNGRPLVYPEEIERLEANLPRFLAEMRPEARAVVEERGYLTNRRKLGLPMLRVEGGWCVFFNQGCVLHKIGAQEGDPYKYKPIACALFPLAKDERDRWYVRQKGYKGEPWDLFCLDPAASAVPAVASLREEMELAWKADEEQAATLAGPLPNEKCAAADQEKA